MREPPPLPLSPLSPPFFTAEDAEVTVKEIPQ